MKLYILLNQSNLYKNFYWNFMENKNVILQEKETLWVFNSVLAWIGMQVYRINEWMQNIKENYL